MVESHWYVIGKDGMTTLCAGEADARKSVVEFDRDWPRCAPHRAVQLVAVTSMESVRAQHSRDSRTLREYAQARDDLRKERDRLREALNWTAAALQAVANEDDEFRMDTVKRTAREILDQADAALAQEKS